MEVPFIHCDCRQKLLKNLSDPIYATGHYCIPGQLIPQSNSLWVKKHIPLCALNVLPIKFIRCSLFPVLWEKDINSLHLLLLLSHSSCISLHVKILKLFHLSSYWCCLFWLLLTAPFPAFQYPHRCHISGTKIWCNCKGSSTCQLDLCDTYSLQKGSQWVDGHACA